MNPFIKRILYWVVGLLTLATKPCVCNITFHNDAANLLIDTTTSELCINNPTKASGWTNRSVVKTFGDNASTAWPEAYTSNTIVAQTTGAGITPARTYLITANSNAICATGGTLLRTTSNLLLYTARTFSSSIYVLRSRADSAAITARTTSNAVNLFYRNLTVPVADSVDGTLFAKYLTNHYVFHNNGNAWTARGWVRFNNGFTVMPQATVLMDTLTTVSGVIDLRDTGVLSLNNDLYLAHNVTLTSGGYIEGMSGIGGQANTIFMGGDLTLASDNYAKVLHITGNWQANANSGDLVIDGCGHTLNIGSQAQIFVDQNVTLTLRNMTIKTSPASFLKPAIQLASMGSKLALDNVMFDLGADFQFEQGQLFIHDEVAVTGTSAFIYSSPKPSYITSGATWSFEQGTTFSIAPATYTDQPFTAGTATSNNFIVLADQSAALSLNNCSLKTTFTGARLSKGMVLFDNKVAIDTQAGSEITGLGSAAGSFNFNATATSVSVSPDGRYVAVIDDSTPSFLKILRLVGGNLIDLTTQSWSNRLQTVAWSPDSKFIAVGGINGSSVGQAGIYRFDGATLSLVTTTAASGIYVYSVAWSPDGRYLAVGGNNGATALIIYQFNGTSLTQVTAINPFGDTIQVNNVIWGPDGKNLTITHRRSSSGNETVTLFSFNGSTLSGINGSGGTLTSYCVAWSPDDRFLIWGYRITGIGKIQLFTTPNWTSLSTVNLGTQVTAASFSPDGRYLLACGANSGAGIYGLYRVSSSGLTLIGSTPVFGTTATAVAWSPDSKYVLVGGNNGATDLVVYPTTISKPTAGSQGFNNGLLFGDKLKGSSFDANVNVLAGAVVKVKGMVKDDSA